LRKRIGYLVICYALILGVFAHAYLRLTIWAPVREIEFKVFDSWTAGDFTHILTYGKDRLVFLGHYDFEVDKTYYVRYKETWRGNEILEVREMR